MSDPRRDGSLGRPVVQMSRLIEQRLASAGVSLAHYRLLAFVSNEDLGPGQIAERLALTPPSVSAAVDGLVERGWIERTVRGEDRRRATLTVTAAGRRVLALADAEAEAAVLEVVALLGARRREAACLDGIEALAEALRARYRSIDDTSG